MSLVRVDSDDSGAAAELLAKSAAAELLARYAEAVDDGDFDAVGRLFAEAVIEDAEGNRIAAGSGEVAALFAATTRRYGDGLPRTTHLVTNVIVEAVNGGELEVRSRFCVLQATDGFVLQPVVTGRYVDRMAFRTDRWVFVRRRMIPELWGDTSAHLAFDPRPVAGAPSEEEQAP